MDHILIQAVFHRCHDCYNVVGLCIPFNIAETDPAAVVAVSAMQQINHRQTVLVIVPLCRACLCDLFIPLRGRDHNIDLGVVHQHLAEIVTG